MLIWHEAILFPHPPPPHRVAKNHEIKREEIIEKDGLDIIRRGYIMKKLICLIIVICFTIILTECSNDSKRLYLSDAEQLVETVELTHPSFTLREVTARYMEAKDSFLLQAKAKMTYKEFVWSIKRYMAALNDGHSGVEVKRSSMIVDANWQTEGDKLFLLEGTERKEITAIGGVVVSDIFQVIDEYYPIENEAAKERNRTIWSHSKDLLLIANCTIDNNKITASVQNEGKTSEVILHIISADIYDFYHKDYEIKSKLIDNVFYIDYKSCTLGSQLSKTVENLEQALSDGIASVIIDVRDNPGGNSEANKVLLEAMGMSEPSYGVYLRYSPLLSKQWKIDETSGDKEYPCDVLSAKRNEDINLVILTNANTYSGATMLGVSVQDGGLGTIIGQVSSNSPNCYGDILYYTLPKSKIVITISCKRFLRPDTNASTVSLIPDIVTKYNEDALDVALEFLRKN